jgi:hypothetical protein
MIIQNSSKENVLYDSEESLLSHYGTCIAQYFGKGELTFKGGEKASCKFEAGQLNNGDVVMLYDLTPPFDFRLGLSVSSFEGTTSDGHKVVANDVSAKINYLPKIPQGRSGMWGSILWREISVQMLEGANINKIHFGITNFEFSGTEGETIKEGKKSTQHNFWILPLDIEGATNLSIKKIKNYDEIMTYISTLKGIDVTCEIEASLSEDCDINEIKEIIDHICYLLSVARGTRIQWIYYNLYNNEDKLVSRTHCNRVTRPYCPLPVIDPRIEGRNETKNFIETAYPIFLRKREAYNLDKGLLEAYLEGKTEGNFLQTRGAKLAVAMEMLKDVFLTTSDASLKELIIDEERFETLLDPLCEGIHVALSGLIEEDTLEKLCCKSNRKRLLCLNRISFRQALKDLCRSINFNPRDDLSQFIHCRDSLVHTGRFYCQTATDEQKAICEPLPEPVYEYFFLVDFLDRIFLKFFNYSGNYIYGKDLRFERKELI